MDQLGTLYVSAAADVQHGCLHDPPRVANLVDQLQTIVDKSTVPRKNFLIDTTTNRGDAVVAESSAMKNGIGWVTLQVTEGIHRGVHEWCIRIEDHGETTDGSGLMVGLVPKNFSKYDSFISQGGGWCLSRAGKFYGHWRRQDSDSDSLTFGTGDRVMFLLDYDAAKLVVRVGNRQASGHVSNLTQEVFPAVSLHYRHQHVRFEYHLVHERHDKSQNWVDRMALPCAAAFLPLDWDRMARLRLDSYLYSPIFAENFAQLHLERIRRSSLVRLGLERDAFAGPESSLDSGAVQHRYGSRESISARLTVLRNALVALHRQAKLGPLTAPFLAPDVTPEHLRQGVFDAAHALRARLALGGRASAGAVGHDATMACGSVLLIHLFVAVARTPSAVADPLVLSLLDYLLSQPLLALREPCEVGNEEPPLFTTVPPATLQLAADNIAAVIEEEAKRSPPSQGHPSPPLPPQQSSQTHARLSGLLSLLLVLSTQRGRVSEMLRSCRLLLRAPPSVTVTDKASAWLRQHTAVVARGGAGGNLGADLWPQPPLFDVQRALQAAMKHASTLAVPTRLDASAPILAVGYSGEMVYVHTREHLSKWGQHQTPHLVLLESTKEPAQLCAGAVQSSLAVTTHAVFLLTNRMRAQGIAVVEYSLSLTVRRTIGLDAAGPLWAGDGLSTVPLGIATAPCDAVVMLRRRQAPVDAGRHKTAAPVRTAATSMELVVYASSGFPSRPTRRVALTAPTPTVAATSLHCLVLEKNGFVDLGPPLILQGSSGHVTVELLVQLPERTATATTLYRHGDKSSCGEVFLETTVLDGARCVRGGYRHDTRGACVVSAPLSPLSDTQFLHLTLVFDGKWNLYFDGCLVSANSQGPHVSLDTPKLNWRIGEECTCAIAGFRAWRVGRTAMEVARDFARLLSGTEPGLVRQLLFSESDGNVVFNYAQVNTSGEAIHLAPEAMAPRHGVCVGDFSHLPCTPSQHLWAAAVAQASLAPSSSSPAPPACSPLHHWLEPGHLFVLPSGHMALASFIAEDADTASAYALTSGTALVFFDAQSGAARPCVTLLPPKVMTQGLVSSDPYGRVWSLVETQAETKVPPDASGSVPSSKSTVLSLTLVAFSERREVLSDAATASELHRPATANLQDAIYPTDDDTQSVDKVPAPLTCAKAAQSLLRVVAAHAALPMGLVAASLYAPLRDDVCKETIQEVVALLSESVRVVKGSNARRTVSLKDAEGPLVVLCALRVLSRLLRQAGAYRLHPSVLDLQPADAEDERLVLQELVPPCTNTSANARSSAATVATAESSPPPSSTVRRLLSLLASVLNDGALALPPNVLSAAEDALREGVNLIFASVDLRASVLQRVLEADAAAAAAAPTSASVTEAASCRAVHVVKQALERSFSVLATTAQLFAVTPSLPTVPAAAAVPTSSRRLSLSLSELLEAQQKKLQRVQGLVEAILTASLHRMRLCVASVAPPASVAGASSLPPSPRDAPQTVDGLVPEHHHELLNLSGILSTLQILLLGTCITPGQPTPPSSSEAHDAAQGPQSEEAFYACVTAPFAIHEETDLHHHAALQAYYAALFRAAREGLQLLLREKNRSVAASAKPATALATATATPAAALTRATSLGSNSSPSGSPLILLTAPLSRSQSLTTIDGRLAGGRRRRSMADPFATVAELSFLAAPLHTALTALPYALTPRNAAWFLSELQALLPLTESAQRMASAEASGPIASSSAFAVIHEATVFALGWASVFLATTTSAQAQRGTHAQADHHKSDEEAEVQWLLASPFLASGVGTMASDAVDTEGLARPTKHPSTSAQIGTFAFPTQATAATAPTTTAAAHAAVSPTARQLDAQALRRSQTERCLAIQRGLDALGQSTPAALMQLLTDAAVTMLYLSNTRTLRGLSEPWLSTQLPLLFTRLIPLRNALLPRFRERTPTAGPSTSSAACAEELTARCQFLLTASHPSEEDVLSGPAYETLRTCGRSRYGSPLSTPQSRWKTALAQLRERLALRRLLVGGAENLTLSQAISTVTRVLLSDQLTAARLSALCERATHLATQRRDGLKALRHLLVRVPSSVEGVAFLLCASDGTAHQDRAPPHATPVGYGICDDTDVRLAPAPLRQALAAALHVVLHRVHLAELATAQDARQLAVLVATATAFEVHRCPTSVLCDALQFSWGARDLPFLRLSGAVADVFTRHGSLFVSPLPAQLDEAATEASLDLLDADTTTCIALAYPPLSPPALPSAAEGRAPPLLLREESPTERRHRDKAAQFTALKHSVARLTSTGGSAAGQRRPTLSADDDDELAEGSTLVTTRELNTRRVFLCLQRLGLHCCRALSEEAMPLTDKLCGVHFMSGLLDIFSAELEKCAQCISGTGMTILPFLPGVVERVVAQVRLVCSVLSTYAGALPTPPVAGPNVVLNELSTACARTSYWLLVNAGRIKTCVMAKAACLRAATGLLSRCHPTGCDAFFATVPGAIKQASSGGTTLAYLVRLAAHVLNTRGVDAAAVHAVEGLRALLATPQWTRHLATPAASAVLRAARQPPPSATTDRSQAQLAVLALLCALGGCLLHAPVKGMPCEVFPSGITPSGLPTNACPLTGYLVDLTARDSADDDGDDGTGTGADTDNENHTEPNGKAKKSKDKGSNSAPRQACVEVHGAAPAIVEMTSSLDSVFLPANSATAMLPTPAASGTSTLCPAWACDPQTAKVVVDVFLAPAVLNFPNPPADGAAILASSTDMACLVAVLDLVRQLATSAPVCHTLVVSGVLRAVCGLAATIPLQSTLPPRQLKEFAALTWHRALQPASARTRNSAMVESATATSSPSTPSQPPRPQSTTPPPPRRVPPSPSAGSTLVDARGPLSAALSTPVHQRTPTASVGTAPITGSVLASTTSTPATSRIANSHLADLMRVRAQVVSLMAQDPTTMEPLLTSSFLPNSISARVLMGPGTAANGGRPMGMEGRVFESGETGYRPVMSDSLRTLCFHGTPRTRVVGTMTITSAPPQEDRAALATLCADGCTVELAVLLCHRVFVQLGQSYQTYGTLAPGPFVLDLVTLMGGPTGDDAVLTVFFAEGQIHCAMHDADTAAATRPRIICSLPVHESDFDRFLHVAVFVEASGVTLSKDGVTATVDFPADAPGTNRVRALFSGDAGVQQVIVGSRVASSSVGAAGAKVEEEEEEEEEEDPVAAALDVTTVLLSGVRISSGTTLRASVKALADMVTRNRALPMLEPNDEPCAFTFHGRHGATAHSTSGEYEGRLRGAVFWTPLYYGVPSLAKDRREALYTGCSGLLRHRDVDGAAASPGAGGVGAALPPSVPRRVLDDYLEALAVPELEQHALDQLWTLCAYTSREAVVTALETCTRPTYALECEAASKSTTAVSASSDIFRVLSKARPLTTLFHLLSVQDVPELPVAHVQLIQSIVTVALQPRTDARTGLSAQEQQTFVLDMAHSMPENLEDTRTKITVRLPLGSAVRPSSATTATSQEASVVIPIAVTGLRAGAELSFDKGLPPSADQVHVCRDASLSAVLATYPDAKASWDVLDLPQDCPYVYLRVLCVPTATAASRRGEAVPLTVRLRSWRPVMARAAFAAVCACALRLCADGIDSSDAWPIFRGELVAVLASQCLMGGPMSDESTHAAAVLRELLQTWSALPHVAVAERAPLHILLAPLNEMLVTLNRSRWSAKDTPAKRSPTLGRHNVYMQELYGVLAAAQALEAAWCGVKVEQVLQHRWRRTIKIWQLSTVYVARDPPEAETASHTASFIPWLPDERINAARAGGTGRLPRPVDVGFQPRTLLLGSAGGAAAVVTVLRIGITGGVFYYELHLRASLAQCCDVVVGVVSAEWYVPPGATLEDALGADAHSWVFSGTRLCRTHNGVRHDFPGRLRWKPGDVIGILIDIPQQRLVCTQNGRHVSAFDKVDIAAAGTVPLFPCVALRPATGAGGAKTHGLDSLSALLDVTCRINPGGLHFSYPPGCDYLALDPMHYADWSCGRLWLLALSAQWSATAAVAARQRRKRQQQQQLPSWPAHSLSSRDDLLAAASPCVAAMASEVARVCAGRAGPMWVHTLTTRRSQVAGTVEISAGGNDITDRVVQCEDGEHGVMRGTVSVTRGAWYYEVEIRRGAATALSVGWTTTTSAYQNDGGAVLGEDEHSWVLEGMRMVAKHAGTQRNLDHSAWVDGDILGCALDCDAGTMSFSLNGVPLTLMAPVTGRDGASADDAAATTVFAQCREAGVGQGGLTPAICLRGKCTLRLHWGRTELRHRPPRYRPLQVAQTLLTGLFDHVILKDHRHDTAESRASEVATLAALPRKVAQLCATADMSPSSLSAYCLDVSTPLPASTTAGHATPPPGPPLSASTVPTAEEGTVAAYVKAVSGMAELLFPFADGGALPLGVDPSDAGWALRDHAIRQTLASCRSCSLPYTSLHALQSFLKRSNGPVESVRLTLNRRRALAVARDGSLSANERVQRSLVGQVHSLLQHRDPSMFFSSKKLWSVLFSGEGAEDVGGPYRECLSQMTSELMSATLPFFVPSDNQTGEVGECRDLFIPNPACTSTFDRMVYLFVGRLMGGCLRGSEPLSLFLPSVVWKALLGDAATTQDLAQLDQATEQALAYVETCLATCAQASAPEAVAAEAALDETLLTICPGGFSVTDATGQVHELVDRGASVPVTSRNARLYVMLVRDWKLSGQYAVQLDALKEGFLQVVPRAAIAHLQWFELEKAVCGQRDYDPDALLDSAQYDGMAPDDQRVLFLRHTLRDFTAHERALFMRFVSGRERLPQGVRLRIQPDAEDDGSDDDGSAGRRGQTSRASVSAVPQRPSEPRASPSPRRLRESGPTEVAPPAQPASSPPSQQRLPHASTCFFILTLPRYRTQEVLRDKLLFAIEQCIDMDADFRVRDGEDTAQLDGPVLAQVESDDDLFEDFTHLQ